MATQPTIRRRLLLIVLEEEIRAGEETSVRQPSAPTRAIARAHRSGVFVWADAPAEEIVKADLDAGPPSSRPSRAA